MQQLGGLPTHTVSVGTLHSSLELWATLMLTAPVEGTRGAWTARTHPCWLQEAGGNRRGGGRVEQTWPCLEVRKQSPLYSKQLFEHPYARYREVRHLPLQASPS